MTRARNVADAGAVLLNTTSFTSASAVNLNNVFNSTYDAYRVVLLPSAVSANCSLTVNLRVNGVNDSTAAYFRGGYFIAIGGSLTGLTANSDTKWTLGSVSTSYADQGGWVFDFINPAKAVRTIGSMDFSNTANNSALYLEHYGIVHAVQSAYDGFSLTPSTGNITGTIKIYGYK